MAGRCVEIARCTRFVNSQLKPQHVCFSLAGVCERECRQVRTRARRVHLTSRALCAPALVPHTAVTGVTSTHETTFKPAARLCRHHPLSPLSIECESGVPPREGQGGGMSAPSSSGRRRGSRDGVAADVVHKWAMQTLGHSPVAKQ